MPPRLGLAPRDANDDASRTQVGPPDKLAGDGSPVEHAHSPGSNGGPILCHNGTPHSSRGRHLPSGPARFPRNPSPVSSSALGKMVSIGEDHASLEGRQFAELLTSKVGDLLQTLVMAREEAHADAIATLQADNVRLRQASTDSCGAASQGLPFSLDAPVTQKVELRLPVELAGRDAEPAARPLTAPPPQHTYVEAQGHRRWRTLAAATGATPLQDGVSASLPVFNPFGEDDERAPDGSVGMPVSCASRASKVSRRSDGAISIMTGEPARQRLTVRRAWTSVVMAGQSRPGDVEHWTALRNQGSSSIILKRGLSSRDSLDDKDVGAVLQRESRIMLRPDAPCRIAFEVMSVFALLHDSVVLPYVYAWEPVMTPYLRGSMWCVMMFWSMDLIMNFFTGYYIEGEVEMHWRRIARNYFRHWFMMDFTFCLCDWVGAVSELTSVQAVEIALVLRVGRFFRLAALVRVVRHYSRIMNLADVPLSRNQSFLLQCLQLLVAVFWANHFSACVWYKIGTWQDPDTGLRWLDAEASALFDDGRALVYGDAPILFQYTTAMHWSMTQMTPGSMEVFPVNTLERIWNIIFLFFGLLFGTSLVSYFSSKMVQYRIAMREDALRMELLRRFLHENEVTAGLSNRVQKQVRARMWMRTRLTEQEVPALELLTSSMRNEVRREAFLRHLVRHPLFQAIAHYSDVAVTHLCTNGAVSFSCVAQGEEYFTPGEEAHQTSLVLKGEFRFTPVFGLSDEMMRVPMVKDVEAGAWLCEVALWMDWRHQGTLEAKTTCEMLAVSSAGFYKSVHKFKKIWPLISDWCAAFQTSQLGMDDIHANDDLDVGADHCGLMFSLPEATSEFVQTASIQLFKATMGLTRLLKGHVVGKYEDEMALGTTLLYIDGTGSLVKGEHLIDVQFMCPAVHRKMLVKLGDLDPDRGGWSSVCELPGRRARRGESARHVLDSIIESDFPSFIDGVSMGSEESTMSTWVSGDGCVINRMHTTFCALLEQEKLESMEELVVTDHKGLEGSFLQDLHYYAVQSCATTFAMYAWLTHEEFENLQDRPEARRGLDRLMGVLPMPANAEIHPSPANGRRRWRRDSTTSRYSIADLSLYLSEGRGSPRTSRVYTKQASDLSASPKLVNPAVPAS